MAFMFPFCNWNLVPTVKSRGQGALLAGLCGRLGESAGPGPEPHSGGGGAVPAALRPRASSVPPGRSGERARRQSGRRGPQAAHGQVQTLVSKMSMDFQNTQFLGQHALVVGAAGGVINYLNLLLGPRPAHCPRLPTDSLTQVFRYWAVTSDSGLLNLLPESPDPFEASITFSLPPPAFKLSFLKPLASICSLNKTAAVATLPFQMLLTTNYSPRVLARISPLFYLAPRTHLLNSKAF